MLTGQGIGAKFRRTGEIFHLENGVSAVVFERLALLDDADMAALQARWRVAREKLGFDGSGGGDIEGTLDALAASKGNDRWRSARR
jgi:hypothetical protein